MSEVWAVKHNTMSPMLPVGSGAPGSRRNAEAYCAAHSCCRIVPCTLVPIEDIDAIHREMAMVQEKGLTQESRHFARTWGRRFRGLFLKHGWRPRA